MNDTSATHCAKCNELLNADHHLDKNGDVTHFGATCPMRKPEPSPAEHASNKRVFQDYSLPRETIEEAKFYYHSQMKDRKNDGNLLLIIPRKIVNMLDISPYTSTRAGKKSFRVIIVRTK